MNRDPCEDQLVRFERATLVRSGRMGPGLVAPDRNNWAPRLGLAWSVGDKNVIRGAFGIYCHMIDMGNAICDMARTLAGLRRDYTDASFPDLTLERGLPTTPANGVEIANQGGFSGQRPNATGVNPNLDSSERTPKNWFNKAAFVRPALYTYGNAGRNTVIGPGIILLDLNATKEFRLTESKYVEFRAEFFNSANHPVFATPTMNMASASYGQVTSTKIDSRQIQFALKIVF